MSVVRVLLFIFVAAGLPAYAKPAPAHDAGSIRWQPCHNAMFQRWFQDTPPQPGLQCGYLDVPLIYGTASNPLPARGEVVRLALTRLPATGEKKGSVVMIPGGPGLSGINPYLPAEPAIAKLRKSYDVIGYDPRGVGQSAPKISCQMADDDETPALDDNDIAGAEKQVRAMISACIKQTGAQVVQHVGTEEAVSDLNAIRYALGEPALNAVAYAYGTKVAALYAERFPKRTRALVLDGVVDISEDEFTRRISQERAYQQSFLRFAAFCAKTTRCPLPSDPNLAIQAFHALLSKLHAAPFVTQAGYEIYPDDVIAVTRALLLWPQRWPELAQVLEQIASGQAGEQASTLIDESYAPDAEDARNVITCADSATPEADEQMLRRKRQAINTTATFTHYLPLHEYPLEMCDLWPYPGKDSPHVPRLSPALPPLLFVARRYDAATPYRSARMMASWFKSPLVTQERDGHTLALHGIDRCVDDTVVDYLLAPKKPRHDKTCR